MLQISGGKITYGRTVKTGDYENKRADVEMHFSGDDGDDFEELIAMAGAIALKQCHAILGLKAPALPASTPSALPTPAPAAPAEPKRRGRPPAVKPAPAPAAPAEDELSLDDAPAPEPAEADVDLGLDEPKEITDKDLSDAITSQQAKSQDKAASAQKIKALFKALCPAGTIPSFRGIPPERRAEFLESLKTVG